MAKETAEQIISRVLKPGEKLLWSGRPDVEALTAHWADETTLTPIARGPRSGQLIPTLRLRTWAESLVYGITDQRLLILENNILTDAYTPVNIRLRDAPRLLSRGPDHGDVVFDSTLGDDVVFPHALDPGRIRTSFDRAVRHERRIKAFKGLTDAEAVRQRVAEWLRGHKGDVQDALRAFIERASDDDAAVCASISNDRLGLSIVLPAGMDIQVRTRRQPSGTTLVEEDNWYPLGGIDNWNVLKARTELDFGLELELFNLSQPTITLNWLKGGLITRLLGGKIQAVRDDLQHGAFRGFSTTRRSMGNSILRQIVLYDGRQQLYAQIRWPETSEFGERACDMVIDSLRVGG